jgi:integrase/recombinase XerC
MPLYHAGNERMKRQYFVYLKEAKRHSEATIDEVAKAVARFEEHTRYRDFKSFRQEQAVAFKRYLSELRNRSTGETLSKSTHHKTLAELKKFFQWLALQPGFRSRIRYSDAEYFNESQKDLRVASDRREGRFPTLEQIKHVITTIPCTTEIEKRNRALIAFILLTGARDRAVASTKLKHVDLNAECVHQDAREVATKFSKSFVTYFFPVGEEILKIVVEWIEFLRGQELWGNDDPLFPATEVKPGPARQFEVTGLKRAPAPTLHLARQVF